MIYAYTYSPPIHIYSFKPWQPHDVGIIITHLVLKRRKVSVTCSKSHSQWMTGPGFACRQHGCRVHILSFCIIPDWHFPLSKLLVLFSHLWNKIQVGFNSPILQAVFWKLNAHNFFSGIVLFFFFPLHLQLLNCMHNYLHGKMVS